MSIVMRGEKGLTWCNSTKAYRGYTLFAPMGSKDVWLIDMQGNFVNRWRMPYKPACHGLLLPNGNLLYAGQLKSSREWGLPEGGFGGIGGILLEVDWEGNIIWKAEVPYQGHDFYPMENGHIMYKEVVYDNRSSKGFLPSELAAKIIGGRPGTEFNGEIWGDILVEIDRAGKVVWEWLAYEHLDPEIDTMCPLENRYQWPYINSVWVCRDGNVLVSCRHEHQIIKIDKATSKVVWRWGKGELGHQHDCRELDNGNILIFDNGVHRPTLEPSYSRSVEVNPKTNEIVWQYVADPPSDFFSAVCGGCERLPNGNTIICEATSGRMFEVTEKGELVWEYINPFVGPCASFTSTKLLFRAHRYGLDYPGLKGKDLDPERFAWANRFWGPTSLSREIKS